MKGNDDMKAHKKYTTAERKRKEFAAVMLLIMIILIVWMVLELCGILHKQTWQPDIEYPMANAKISWEQSFRPGGWTE